MRPPLRICVIGAGSWGTALAMACARRHPTVLWARQAERAAAMQAARENAAYLPGLPFPETLRVTADARELALHAFASPWDIPLFILGVPVAGLEAACRLVAELAEQRGDVPAGLVWTCKGLSATTGELPHEVAQRALRGHPGLATGVVSGPSFAREVAQGLPVALTVASGHTALRRQVTEALHGDAIRVYGSTDVLGVELGGAMKNVLAIAVGVSDGMGLGTNARAALITRGLAEMTRLGVALGAREQTFAGLTGLGDLVLTATGDLSRNRRVGLGLGRGERLEDVLGATNQVAEGVRCARQIQSRARAHGVDVPIVDAVCRLLFDGVSPRTALLELMARDPRTE